MGITEELQRDQGVATKKVFKSSDKIGEIAARFPTSMEIFQEYKIDFCCGGNRPLKAAIEEQGIDESELLAELNQAYLEKQKKLEEDVDWDKASFSDLMDHIVDKHHAYLRKNLPEISELVTTILRVHGKNHGDVLREVHRLFHTLKMDLEQHLIREEEDLFPAIREYEQHPSWDNLEKTAGLIEELEDDHEMAGDILKDMREITADYVLPADGCETYELTYRLLEEMEKDLFAHIHLENNILFSRLRKD